MQANASDALDEKAAELFTSAHMRRSLQSKAWQAWAGMHHEQQDATSRARVLLQRMMHSQQVRLSLHCLHIQADIHSSILAYMHTSMPCPLHHNVLHHCVHAPWDLCLSGYMLRRAQAMY